MESTSYLTFETGALGLILLLVLLACCQHYRRRQRFRGVTAKLPTLYGAPFIGIAHQLVPIEKFLYQIDAHLNQLQTATYCAWLGGEPYVITVDPDIIRRITTSAEFLDKSPVLYTPINNAMPNGLITSRATKWKHNRKLMNTFLGQKTLLSFMPIFHKGTDATIQQLNAVASAGERELFHLLKCINLEVAIETTMGVEAAAQDKPLTDAFTFIMEKIAHDAMYSTMGLGFLARTPKYYKCIAELRAYIRNLMQLNNNNIECNPAEFRAHENGNVNGKENNRSTSFLSQALGYYRQGLFDEEDVIVESITMIAASFETVSTAIFSTLVMLAMHPAVQEKLYSEALSLLPHKHTQLGYEQLKEATYLDMVICETLRLMPSVPVIGRQVTQATQLTPGVTLPAQMQIIIPIFNLHRRPELWGAQAQLFNPDNFLPENVERRSQYAYLPFSKGARMCIGWRYAEISVRVVVLRLVRNFRFSTTFRYEDLRFIDYISLCYKVEPKLSVECRDSADGDN